LTHNLAYIGETFPMRSRRQFIQLSCSLVAAVAARGAQRMQAQSPARIWLPLIQSPPGDAPIVGPASGTIEQAIEWLAARSAAEYPRFDVATIVDTYQQIGDSVGMDWFLAIAQMAHETGSLTSWWSGRPRRNPAGIGVTGRTQEGTPDVPPAGAWAWDDTIQRWREGVSFPTWANHGVPAHLGRLLAYALRDDQANQLQRELIATALSYRALPASYRGVARVITDLNGRWAVPGTDYGQRIMDLARRMRGE
jgi:hypothetical protein